MRGGLRGDCAWGVCEEVSGGVCMQGAFMRTVAVSVTDIYLRPGGAWREGAWCENRGFSGTADVGSGVRKADAVAPQALSRIKGGNGDGERELWEEKRMSDQ
eukprot:1160804-Pelagomonas_calceolata.AAC.35